MSSSSSKYARAVMDNPARELHRIFSKWRDAFSTPPYGGSAQLEVVRNMDTRAGIDESVRAIRLLQQIEMLIAVEQRNGEDVSIYTSEVESWYHAVFAYPHGWKQGTEADAFMSTSSLSALRFFSRIADHLASASPTGEVARAEDAIRQGRQLLADDATLTAELKRFISKLIDGVERALNQHRLGLDVDLEHELQVLMTSFSIAHQRSSDPSLKDKWKTLFWDVAGGAGGGALADGIASAGGALLQILP